jgi:hypothetical protein
MRLPTPILLVALAMSAVLSAGCGASSLRDSETAAEAQAAVPAETTMTAAAMTVESTPAPEATAEPMTVPAADNAGAWSVIQDGAQQFAARLDQANQSIASCQTDAAAGASFDACMGAAYTAIATAAGELDRTVEQAIGQTDGPCRDALTALRKATGAMVDDYSRVVATTDLTSRETLEARLGDDAQAYADEALTAAATCIG